MKPSDQYLKIVEWSEKDECYIGRVPALSYGGVHGDDEAKVYAELVELTDELIEVYQEDGMKLPPPTAGRAYSGKFNLRVGEELHERLALESMKVSESLNTYVVKTLKKKLGMLPR
ncbi:MAG: toxin-antitoxin system HicB family antitoxin [Xanthomonadales bacterium]